MGDVYCTQFKKYIDYLKIKYNIKKEITFDLKILFATTKMFTVLIVPEKMLN